MTWFAAVSGKRGRRPKFSDAAIQFCLTLKNLFRWGLHDATGLVESVLQLSGLNWPTPDFRTVSRRQQMLNVQIPYTRSRVGWHLLLDSTGIKCLGEGQWKYKKHGAQYCHQWRKLRIAIDKQMMQIRAICVTSNNVSDAAVISDLRDQLPQSEKLERLTGDGAYDTKPVYEAVIGHGATPIIPSRKNARIRKGSAFAHRNAAIAACRRLGRKKWKAWRRLPSEKLGGEKK